MYYQELTDITKPKKISLFLSTFNDNMPGPFNNCSGKHSTYIDITCDSFSFNVTLVGT